MKDVENVRCDDDAQIRDFFNGSDACWIEVGGKDLATGEHWIVLESGNIGTNVNLIDVDAEVSSSPNFK